MAAKQKEDATEAVQETAAPNIHQRFIAAMADCGYVQKDGYNSFSKYKYVTHDAVVEHVRPALVKNGIVPITRMLECEWPEGATTHGGKANNICRVKMEVSFVNADAPADQIVVAYWGEAADTGDKAIFKAISGAKKYIFTNTFMLASGDDPETDSPEYKQPAKTADKPKRDLPPNATRATPVTGSLDDLKARYVAMAKDYNIDLKAFGEAFGNIVAEDERKNPVAVNCGLLEMERRVFAWKDVLAAISKWSVSGDMFDAAVAKVVGGDEVVSKNNYFLYPSKTLSALADQVTQDNELPFDADGKAIPV